MGNHIEGGLAAKGVGGAILGERPVVLIGAVRGFRNDDIGGGLGVSHIDIDTTRMRFTRTATIVPDGQQFNFAWMLTGGVGIPLTEKITFDLAYRYTDFGTVETSDG